MEEVVDIIQQIDKNGIIELEFVPKEEIQVVDVRSLRIEEGLQRLEQQKEDVWIKLDATAEDLEKLQCNADELDYAVAFSSGIIAGVVDSFLVGEWDFTSAKEESNRKINEKVNRFAKKNGYKGERLSGAVKFLEDHNKLLGDDDWKGADIGVSAKTHHLDDWCHHPTLVGLLCCLIREFTRDAVYYNSRGEKHVVALPLGVDEEGNLTGETVETKLFAGTVNWCLNVARNWKGHLYSDMAGSKATAGAGMGIPGPLMSLFKELSALPIVKDGDLPKKLKEAYTKGIGTEKGQLDLGWANVLFEGKPNSKMDLRTEKAVSSLLGKQALPVLLNGILVYSFYVIRQFINENRAKKEGHKPDLKKCFGVKNTATLVRMFTVASGTFTAFDAVDATVRSGFSKKQFVLRLNFVGIGAFAVTLGAETVLGIKRGRLVGNQRKLYSELNDITCAEIYYKNAGNRMKFMELVEISEQLRLSMRQEVAEIEIQNGEGTAMDKAEVLAQVDTDIVKAEQISSPEKKGKKIKPFWKRGEELQVQLESVKTLQDMVNFFQSDMVDLMKYTIELNDNQKKMAIELNKNHEKLKKRTNFVCGLALIETVAIVVLLVTVVL